MSLNLNQILKLIILTLIALTMLFSPVPSGLSNSAWQTFILFFLMIFTIMTKITTIEVATIISLLIGLITGLIPIKATLEGFINPAPWIVFFAFTISKSVIKTNLGKIGAYLMLSKFGFNKISIVYCMSFLSTIIAPFLPSNTARCGGIILPIADSIIDSYSKNIYEKQKFGSFLNLLCFQADNIACATFLTAISGNALVLTIAKTTLNIDINFLNWAKITIIPCIISTAILPLILMVLIPLKKVKSQNLIQHAKDEILKITPLKKDSKSVLYIICALLILWITQPINHIPIAISALFGTIALILTGVFSWSYVVKQIDVWKIFIWIAIFIIISKQLALSGFIIWLVNICQKYFITQNMGYNILIIGGLCYLSHYFFASSTAHISSILSSMLTFAMILKIEPILATVSIAAICNLSGGVTNYSTGSAPLFFEKGYFSQRQWFFYSGICSLIITIIFCSTIFLLI